MNHTMRTTINANGRIIGSVEDGIFRKRVKGSSHILRKPRAIALSIESLAQAEQAGAQEIQVEDIESNRIYRAGIEYFKKYSFPVQRGGFEPQRALRLERWSVTGSSSVDVVQLSFL